MPKPTDDLRNSTMNNKFLALLLAAATPLAAWADRPISTDDAGAVETGTCTLESWFEHGSSERALHLGSACGIASQMDFGGDISLPRQRDLLRSSASLAFKWVPDALKVKTVAGALAFGVKLGTAFERPADQSWRASQYGALALATLLPSDDWALHANLGAARDRASGSNAGMLNLAVVWTPREDALLFAETMANSRSAVFGGTVNTAGGRWWVVKERFGLDLTASRENGFGNGTSWTIGFGWYGLTF